MSAVPKKSTIARVLAHVLSDLNATPAKKKPQQPGAPVKKRQPQQKRPTDSTPVKKLRLTDAPAPAAPKKASKPTQDLDLLYWDDTDCSYSSGSDSDSGSESEVEVCEPEVKPPTYAYGRSLSTAALKKKLQDLKLKIQAIELELSKRDSA